MHQLPILIVEDDPALARTVEKILLQEGHPVTVVGDGCGADAALAGQPFPVVLLDLELPDTTGYALLEKWVQSYPEMQVVVLTANRELATAVKCVRAGAFDFLVKPTGREMLVKSVDAALRHGTLARQVHVLTRLTQREDPDRFEGIIAESPAMRKTLEVARRIAASDFSCILISGESGVGKGLLARALHKQSLRREHPFVEVNCAAIPAALVESELFGHQKGAFTDAKENRIGVFEMADKGTLFLDEIGDMDLTLQAKLLKVIEEQRFRRIGGSAEVSVNVALIAATNQDIPKRVSEGRFRGDLFYRLHVMPLVIPPLRDRREDVLPLALHFLAHYARRFGKPLTAFSAAAREAFQEYAWPGNVRELRNVIERACLLAQAETIDAPDLLLPAGSVPGAEPRPAAFPPMPLAQAEALAIRAAMKQAGGNQTVAADILQIHRTTLYKKLRALHDPACLPPPLRP